MTLFSFTVKVPVYIETLASEAVIKYAAIYVQYKTDLALWCQRSSIESYEHALQ